ncbi:MAG: Ku protein [Anaeromyxobacter sp. RBG_16_69_14]|nr:MAG: Ku protein [Anaeromyxobacter sp. RBG_16_69_14]
MALRSMATATISFGLVSIPVRLYPATQPSAGLSFNLLHKTDGSRLKQQYVCAKDGEVVPREDMVKGYEFAKDQYVTFSPEELKALEEASSQTIEIAEFVPLSEVDPLYYDKPYYLGPDRGGAKAYRLLAEAMRRAGKAGLARYASRGKQYLVLLRPSNGRLVMQQLLHSDEVRPFSEVEVEEAELKEPEVQLALRLVEQTASDSFHPEVYPDEVRARTMALVEQKVQGKEIQLVPPEAPRAQVIDLMDALKASLSRTDASRDERAPRDASLKSRGEQGEPESKDAEVGRRPPKRAPRGTREGHARMSSKK